MAIDPSKASATGRQALADVLIHIREQLLSDEDKVAAAAAKSNRQPRPEPLARSWENFSAIALRDVGLQISPSNLKKWAPTPAYGNVPNPGLFYALGSWGVFTFPNGEPVTAEALYEVLLELRTPAGDLIGKVRNGGSR